MTCSPRFGVGLFTQASTRMMPVEFEETVGGGCVFDTIEGVACGMHPLRIIDIKKSQRGFLTDILLIPYNFQEILYLADILLFTPVDTDAVILQAETDDGHPQLVA